MKWRHGAHNRFLIYYTVSPKSSQLMFYTLGQLLTEGSSQDLVCKVDRVRPLPKEFYIRFTDNDTRLGVQSELKNDNLTYSLSVKYSLVTTASHQNKQLVCEYVLPTGVILQSALVTLPIFGMYFIYTSLLAFKPYGKQNILTVITEIGLFI